MSNLRVVVYRPEADCVVESVEFLPLPSYVEYEELARALEGVVDGSVLFKDAPGNSNYSVWFRDDGAFDRRLRPSVLGLVGNVVVVPFKGDGFRSVAKSDMAAIARLVRSGRRYS